MKEKTFHPGHSVASQKPTTEKAKPLAGFGGHWLEA